MADHESCPATPRSEDPEDLGFERRKMVDWLSPTELARTGIKAVLSGVFGAYADKREVMAALHPEVKPDGPKGNEDVYSKQDEIWIDYVADIGDGFDATYSMARLLATPRLALSYGEKTYDTERGRILVMGGDQVYPTASFDEYRNRMIMPYTAALPCVTTGETPDLYAVPGNHDWYDGLSNFTRIFCQTKWIGGWRTRQHRSYFAIQLPHGWWLWGIDIQLEGYIDQPQLDFFYGQGEFLKENDRVILCTAEPSWVYAVTKGPEAFSSLAFFENKYVSTVKEKGRAKKVDLKVTLAGDLHHYVHYKSGEGVHRITAGGGGAYLHATHDQPADLKLDEGYKTTARTVEYQKLAAFPDKTASESFIPKTIRLPVTSPGFGRLLAVLYTLFGWLVQSASKSRPDLVENSFLHYLRSQGPENWRDVLIVFIKLVAHSPSSLIFALLILAGLIAFCTAKKTAARVLIGLTHGTLHILLALLLMWVLPKLNTWLLGGDIDSIRQILAFIVEMMLVGAFLGGFLVALYLILFCYVGQFHLNEAFSSQRIPHYKNFLRMHIDATGKLTIYPVGVKKVCTDWKLNPAAKDGQPWFDPGEPVQVELIEEPIPVS